jgi:hypothetical protein
MTTKATKPVKKTRAQLEAAIVMLNAQLAHVYHFADAELHKAGTAVRMGSGVMLELTAYGEFGGKKIIDAVMIKDGLSDATIEAIRADLRRSYELVTAFKPKGAK